MSTKKKLEFGGVPGNLLLVLVLPVVVAFLHFSVKYNDARLFAYDGADWEGFFRALVPTWEAAAIYLGWFALQALLQAFAPGPIVQGTPLPNGKHLLYKMNGRASLVATAIVVGALHFSGVLPIRVLHDRFGELLTVMVIFSYAFSVFLYFYGKATDDRSTGIAIHDFWMGTGHNPRIPPHGLFDLKFFCEARPGLPFWVLLDLACMHAQYETYGFVSLSMVLVCAFQLLYVVDYFWNEPAILTTMDIKHENFGFMLCFGDLVWVPMTYSLQAFYLVDRVHDLPLWAGLIFVALNLLGLYIFRAVNLQKHRFRQSPETATIWGKKAEYLETKQGGKLLVSGFWGWSRHFNYVGDILMAVSWSLPTLFGSIVPYFYPIYFTALLVHRERRDHRICAEKYGEDWEAYCKRVPYRILPGVY
jgi:protein-S-isoprenylcysteine O-methyltransferase Ste14